MKPFTEPQGEPLTEPLPEGMPNYPSPFTLHLRVPTNRPAETFSPQNSPAVQDSADDHHLATRRADDVRTWIPDGDAPRLPRSRTQYVAGPVKIIRIPLLGRFVIADVYTGADRGEPA